MDAVACADSVAIVTADELLRLPDDGWRYELVAGELRRMSPAGHFHGLIAQRVALRLGIHAEAQQLGNVYAAETGFLLSRDPDTVRAPDVAFVQASRTGLASDASGYFPGPPDLAVEVISPGDSFSAVEEKTFTWLAAGTRVVVVVDPRRQTASIYRDKDDIRWVGEGETLDLSDVVPGFTLPLAALFA